MSTSKKTFLEAIKEGFNLIKQNQSYQLLSLMIIAFFLVFAILTNLFLGILFLIIAGTLILFSIGNSEELLNKLNTKNKKDK
ncbi:hypothetical protein [Francisella philomiragia]|uniref:hypothetical protein n=1 Tax=Francisella philomiragia TaxID=28110 RepID=UPI0019045610|nr:hypothetical protein [Francisella philomiragia]MBK2270171.1 hypothetical protein [Francisella philomiragia]MBK2275835.1 hypothetical protein [Francisella philomiragia]MBK2305048.1 hypothetical protein [Francisella philomiragia]